MINQSFNTIVDTFSSKHSLTKREGEVLRSIVNGHASASDISQDLAISQSTVRIHLKNINIKVRSKSKTDLVTKLFQFSQNYF